LTQLSVEYVKYMKNKSYKAIAELIAGELKPLDQLVLASTSIAYFEEKKTKGEVVPGFRMEAAMELFIKSLDDACQILVSCNAIEKPLDTSIMLKRFELANWIDIRPFQFYISQLEHKFSVFRKVLSDMQKCGRGKRYAGI